MASQATHRPATHWQVEADIRLLKPEYIEGCRNKNDIILEMGLAHLCLMETWLASDGDGYDIGFTRLESEKL